MMCVALYFLAGIAIYIGFAELFNAVNEHVRSTLSFRSSTCATCRLHLQPMSPNRRQHSRQYNLASLILSPIGRLVGEVPSTDVCKLIKTCGSFCDMLREIFDIIVCVVACLFVCLSLSVERPACPCNYRIAATKASVRACENETGN
jgi:hypothetical protein